jgi:hypothetical protein
MEPVGVLPFRERESPAACSQHNADSAARIQVEFLRAQSRILQRLSGCSNGESGSPGYVLTILKRKAFQRINITNFAGNLDGDL